MLERLTQLQEDLIEGARIQDEYDLRTINLIAPASPTPRKYFHDIPLMHNAIAEGLLGKRPYAGVEGFNMIESVAVEAASLLFDADHANVQPHSVSQANQAVYQALLNNSEKVLSMKFTDGGHLTHGMPINFSGRFFTFDFYGVDQNGFIDFEALEKKALEFQPKLIVCGASSYPRIINFERFSDVSRRVGAYLMADLSHPAGLVVGNRFPKPFPYCDVVTLTLDKTMLGPHGGIILCKNSLREEIDKAVHPGVQSSIPLRRIYEMAQCLIDSGSPWFTDYIDRIIKNMKVFEREFKQYPNLMVTGGSDTHLMVLDTYNVFKLTGKEAEEALERVGILTNRQVIPGEKLKPYVASGIRFGTSWITARGYSREECLLIARCMIDILKDPYNDSSITDIRSKLYSLIGVSRKNDVWYE